MKKFAKFLALASCVTMLATSCVSPADVAKGVLGKDGKLSLVSGTPGTPGTGSFASKADFIKFAQCVKDKSPDAQVKAAVDVWIAALSQVKDEQWAAIGSVYAGYAKAYNALGCN